MQRLLSGLACAAACMILSIGARASTPDPITLEVDASNVANRVVHTHMRLPVTPVGGGEVTIAYPRWQMGGHAPLGRVSMLTEIHFRAGEKVLPWRRDLLNADQFHVAVPPGQRTVDVDFDVLVPPPGANIALSSERLLILRWEHFLVYIAGVPIWDIPVNVSLRLPADWQFATALPLEHQNGSAMRFNTASLETVVDSPVLTGRYMRKFDLTPGQPVAHEFDVAAESEDALLRDGPLVDKFRGLVKQAQLMFGAEHYRNYHFLARATDYTIGGGIEHHESDDTDLPANFFQDRVLQVGRAAMLPHEYAHSWNGKFRRPADLHTKDFQEPQKTDLLWVYEGLTNYLGIVLAARSNLSSPEETRDSIAADAAYLDHQTGRAWRPLQDTADAEPDNMMVLFANKPDWNSWLRSNEFYAEGTFLWLEANAVIVEKSGGKRSLDDFLKAFFGGSNKFSDVKIYTRADVIDALDKIAPYGWKGFFDERLNGLSRRTPLDALERSGWRLTYDSTVNTQIAASNHEDDSIDAMYSIGLIADKGGVIGDVDRAGPAFAAGLIPGMQVISVNGIGWSPELLANQIAATPNSAGPLVLGVKIGGVASEKKIVYRGGARYPHLMRVDGTVDLLTQELVPRRDGHSN
jgi:predicted metalloprotease with PDZ domain